jgi:hypothetical protein
MHNAKLWVAGRTPALCGSNLRPWDSTSHVLSRDDYAGSNPALGTYFLVEFQCHVRLSVRTLGFQPGKAGSTPARDSIISFPKVSKYDSFVPRSYHRT